MKNKYLILRRIVQTAIFFLYIGGNYFGWKILQGNLSASLVFETIPLADPYAMLQIFFAGGIVSIDLLVGALIIAIFYGLIVGRAFCSWVCPINLISDASAVLRKKLRLERATKSVPFGRNTRYWFFGLGLLLSFVFGLSAFELLSPIGIVQRGIIFGFGFGLSVVVALFLFDLLVKRVGWCGHICPLGAFYALISKYSILQVSHDATKCTLCMKCKDVCPEDQVLSMIGKDSINIKNGECTKCARCIEVCNDDALNFSLIDFLQNSKIK